MSEKKLSANTTIGNMTYPADSVPPKEIAKQITNPKAWGGSLPEFEADSAYSSMKVADLKAEIEKRNADREDDAKLSDEGNKAALIAVLDADDAAADQASGN